MAVGNICLDKSEGLKDRFFIPINRAIDFYNQGATLEFDFAERFFPGLQKIINSLRIKLGLPQGTIGKSILYFSPNSSGFPMHFDAYYNLIFHMGGEKTWILNKNENAILPMEHYDLHEYPYLSEELKSYWKDELPSNLKEKSYRERLIPGSLLYLPRGLWHATSASNFSISINITFSPPTLLEIALAAIRQNLVKQDLLRKNPLSLKKEDYETVNKYLNIIVQNLDFEEIEIQLQENQDKYQVADKAFHSTLELLDA